MRLRPALTYADALPILVFCRARPCTCSETSRRVGASRGRRTVRATPRRRRPGARLMARTLRCPRARAVRGGCGCGGCSPPSTSSRSLPPPRDRAPPPPRPRPCRPTTARRRSCPPGRSCSGDPVRRRPPASPPRHLCAFPCTWRRMGFGHGRRGGCTPPPPFRPAALLLSGLRSLPHCPQPRSDRSL